MINRFCNKYKGSVCNKHIMSLEEIKKDIEKKTEIKIASMNLETMNIISGCISGNTNIKATQDFGQKILGIMKEGDDEFQKKTGRQMTYSEMRQMFG